MQYLIAFLEGIITFISPCLLPMLPIYLVYFAADAPGDGKKKKTLVNSLGFILGFTIVFVLMGAFAASIGSLLKQHQTAVNVISGLVVVIFGLNFMGLFNLKLLNGTHRAKSSSKPLGFFSAIVFGMVFAVGWTPCVGAFLGSALLLASQQGSWLAGVFMLTLYSLGLGIPFALSAVLIDRLKGAFDFIKRHYKTINLVCGLLLIAVGVLMMTGKMGALLAKLTV
ncbi:MAG: cytochrome c biogenesis protein CcdA [Oscillospiraceae bacterium]